MGGHEAAERVRLEWIENERLKLQRSCEGNYGGNVYLVVLMLLE